jgi:chromosome segregation ATPase
MDGTTGAAFAAAALGVGGALLAGTRWRRERSQRGVLEAEVERLAGEAAAARAEADARARARRERSEELSELRRKLEKARKRAFAVQEERAPLEARLAEVEDRLRARDEEAGRLRARAEQLEAERSVAAREMDRLREELARAEGAAAAVRIDPDSHRELGQRVEAAEEEVRRLQAVLREVEHDASRWRQRERVQRRAYTVLRGELEVAKDRIRALRGEAGADPVEDVP